MENPHIITHLSCLRIGQELVTASTKDRAERRQAAKIGRIDDIANSESVPGEVVERVNTPEEESGSM